MRLDAPSQGGRLTGTLLAVESDTLVMEEDGQAAGLRLIILTDSISRLEVRRERSMAFEGAGLGLLGGTLLALVASPDCTDENGEDQTLACLAYKVSPNPETRFFALAVVGTLVGVMVGSETKTQKWAPVRLPRPFIGPTPGGGMALGLRISF